MLKYAVLEFFAKSSRSADDIRCKCRVVTELDGYTAARHDQKIMPSFHNELLGNWFSDGDSIEGNVYVVIIDQVGSLNMPVYLFGFGNIRTTLCSIKSIKILFPCINYLKLSNGGYLKSGDRIQNAFSRSLTNSKGIFMSIPCNIFGWL